jgi:hypothetical protein
MDREEFEENDTNRTLMPKTEDNAEAQYETESETEAGPEEKVMSHDEFEIRPLVNPRAGAAATWSHESVITLLAYIEWCVESGKDFRTEGLLLLSQELRTSIKRSKNKVFEIWVKHKRRKYSHKPYSWLLTMGIESLNLGFEDIQSVRDRVREIRPTTGSSVLPTETTPTRRRLVTIVSESPQECVHSNH